MIILLLILSVSYFGCKKHAKAVAEGKVPSSKKGLAKD